MSDKENSKWILKPDVGAGNVKTHLQRENFHPGLTDFSRIVAILSLLLLLTAFPVFTVFVMERFDLDLLALALFVELSLLLSYLSTVGWKTVRALRKRIRLFHERQTIPTKKGIEGNTILFLVKQVFHIDWDHQTPVEISSKDRRLVASQLFWGSALCIVGLFILSNAGDVGPVEQYLENPDRQNTAVLAALGSILVAPEIGLVILGILTYLSSPSDFLLVVGIVIIPGVIFVPASRNLIKIAENRMYRILVLKQDPNNGLFEQAYPLLIMFLIVSAADAYIFYKISTTL